MSGGIIGDVSNEKFELPNKYIIFIEYGMVDLDGSIRGIKNKFLQIFTRYSGNDRRAILYDNNGNIISEAIEPNPDFVKDDEWSSIPEQGLLFGDEFEKVIHFQNGMVAKIEYWKTPENRDEHFGRYAAKFRRTVLFDETGEIISEIMEHNPSYLSTGNFIPKNQNVDEYELKKLIV